MHIVFNPNQIAMTHHLQTKIETLLAWTDSELQEVFGGFGPDIRKELEDRKEKGEVLIGSVDCDGFDPITGCPGHEVKEVTYDKL
jgi:hypothetical protein